MEGAINAGMKGILVKTGEVEDCSFVFILCLHVVVYQDSVLDINT